RLATARRSGAVAATFSAVAGAAVALGRGSERGQLGHDLLGGRIGRKANRRELLRSHRPLALRSFSVARRFRVVRAATAGLRDLRLVVLEALVRRGALAGLATGRHVLGVAFRSPGLGGRVPGTRNDLALLLPGTGRHVLDLDLDGLTEGDRVGVVHRDIDQVER